MYFSLLEKIKAKINHWANCNLSYAGKIQLINTVVFGIESFWCASFMLPKGVIHEIDKMCRRFLWGYQGAHKLVFFAWQKVCRSRAQGGFDIREILSWNKTLLLRMFWRISTASPSIWVQWCQHYHLQGFDCWSVKPSQSTSTVWKALFAARDEFVGLTGSLAAAHASLQEWSRTGKLHLYQVYAIFHGRHSNLQWAKPTLDGVVMPRHAMLVRMAVQKGLATTDNLNRRGLHLVNRCYLCMAAAEDHPHLFFSCSFSRAVYQTILLWLGVTRRPLCLHQELLKLSRYRGKGWRKKRARCSLAATVYFLWQERNWRIFRGVSRTIEQVVYQIKYYVSIRLYANINSSILEEVIEHMTS
ncbi:uncharacterized protein LOC141588080 [Silene latifolia]|uniref:uncharacterized protein LOC141588080 n=1 Tax=Silene latifolia TaxID=37657 RepID=UPI003D7843AB